jgi:hypothetical protein
MENVPCLKVEGKREELNAKTETAAVAGRTEIGTFPAGGGGGGAEK